MIGSQTDGLPGSSLILTLALVLRVAHRTEVASRVVRSERSASRRAALLGVADARRAVASHGATPAFSGNTATALGEATTASANCCCSVKAA
jgi:hypothetical protein